MFTVHMPEIALVRFLVWDHDPIGRDFIGQRTLAFSSMMPGEQLWTRCPPHWPRAPGQGRHCFPCESVPVWAGLHLAPETGAEDGRRASLGLCGSDGDVACAGEVTPRKRAEDRTRASLGTCGSGRGHDLSGRGYPQEEVPAD